MTDANSLYRWPPFPPTNADEREELLRTIRTVPLAYGIWKGFKQVYWAADDAQDPGVLAALLARLDCEWPAPGKARSPRMDSHGNPIPVPAAASIQISATNAVNCLAGGEGWLAAVHPGGVAILNTEDPSSLTVRGVYQEHNCSQAVAQRNRLFVVRYSPREQCSQLDIVEVPNAGNPRRLGRYSASRHTSVTDVVPYGRYLLVLETDGARRGALLVVDFSDPATPTCVARAAVPGACRMGITRQGVFISTGGRWGEAGHLRGVDLRNILKPRILDPVSIPEGATAVLAGRLLSGEGWYNEPFVLADAADSGSVTFGSTMRPRTCARETAARGSLLAALSWDGWRMRVWDVACPEHPRFLWQFRLPNRANSLAWGGDRLFAGGGDGRVWCYSFADPEFLTPASVGPRPATLRYMKRQGRRLLRRRADENPAAYVELAAQMLLEAGKQAPELDSAEQWLSLDVLFGGGGRVAQRRHGRGPCEFTDPRVPRRRREERLPEAWNARPDLARQLWAAEVPWETLHVVGQILQAGGNALPPLGLRSLERALVSGAPWLIRHAVQEIGTRVETGERLSGVLGARFCFAASGGARRRLEGQQLALREGEGHACAAELVRLLGMWLPRHPASGRARSTARLLGDALARFVEPHQFLPLLGDLLASDVPELAVLAERVMRQPTLEIVRRCLLAACAAEEPARDRIWAALLGGVPACGLTSEQAFGLLAECAARLPGREWELFGALRLRSGEVGTLWRRRWPEVGGVPPDQWRVILRHLRPEVLLEICGGATDAEWPALREALLAFALVEGRADDLRRAFFPAGGDVAPQVRQRVLGDPVLLVALGNVPEPGILELQDPALEDWLVRQLDAMRGEWAADWELVLRVAVHPLPRVRALGLEWVAALAPDLRQSLHLVESGLADAVAVGKRWFTTLPPGAPSEREAALALCDSPDRDARALGRAFLTARPASVPLQDLVGALAQHDDPEMRRFLAEQLRDAEVSGAEVAAFDARVLRTRRAGRRAKEAVQARLGRTGGGDPAVLVELARGRTPRDAEWALGELARRALAGEEVPGVHVRNPAAED